MTTNTCTYRDCAFESSFSRVGSSRWMNDRALTAKLNAFPFASRRTIGAIAGLFVSFTAATTDAQISLAALQRDGYGVVELKRPEPNVLTIIAEIDGRKMRLIVDTGWGHDGLSLQKEHLSDFRGQSEDLKEFGTSATGKKMANFKKASAKKVVIGNVELAHVPMFFGRVTGIEHSKVRRSLGADGFLGAGFLRTCSAIVDLHNLRLYLRPPGKGRRAILGPALQAAGLAEVPFSMGGGNCLVDAELNGATGKMVIDTGASHAGVDKRMAPRMKAHAYKSRTGFIDAAGVIRASELSSLRSFKIGGLGARAPDIRMLEYGFYTQSGGKVIGVLGMDILGPNGAIIDFGQQKLYFYAVK